MFSHKELERYQEQEQTEKYISFRREKRVSESLLSKFKIELTQIS